MTRWPNGKAPDYGSLLLFWLSSGEVLHYFGLVFVGSHGMEGRWNSASICFKLLFLLLLDRGAETFLLEQRQQHQAARRTNKKTSSSKQESKLAKAKKKKELRQEECKEELQVAVTAQN